MRLSAAHFYYKGSQVMSESLLEKIGAFFASDKRAYWWKLLTDYERSLSKMSLSELASELQRTQVRNELANTVIVEHMLAARLARIQSRAAWWSGWLGFSGAMLAAALTFYLGQLSADSAHKIECAHLHSSEEKSALKPVQSVVPALKQNAPEKKAVQAQVLNGTGEKRNAPSKP